MKDLNKIIDDIRGDDYGPMNYNAYDEAREDIKKLFKEIVGELEQRETEDMSLDSWSDEDLKAFGKNELKIELNKKIEQL